MLFSVIIIIIITIITLFWRGSIQWEAEWQSQRIPWCSFRIIWILYPGFGEGLGQAGGFSAAPKLFLFSFFPVKPRLHPLSLAEPLLSHHF